MPIIAHPGLHQQFTADTKPIRSDLNTLYPEVHLVPVREAEPKREAEKDKESGRVEGRGRVGQRVKERGRNIRAER